MTGCFVRRAGGAIACRLTSRLASPGDLVYLARGCDMGRPPRGHRLVVSFWRWEAVAVAFSMAWPGDAVDGGPGRDEAWRLLAGFRGEFYRCLPRRGDALYDLADAVLCAGGRVTDLARLSLVPEFRRG